MDLHLHIPVQLPQSCSVVQYIICSTCHDTETGVVIPLNSVCRSVPNTYPACWVAARLSAQALAEEWLLSLVHGAGPSLCPSMRLTSPQALCSMPHLHPCSGGHSDDTLNHLVSAPCTSTGPGSCCALTWEAVRTLRGGLMGAGPLML